MRVTPFEKPSTTPSRRESMRPMKNVKPSSSATPQPLFLRLLDAVEETEGDREEHA